MKILLALTFAVAFIACEKIESVKTSDERKDCIVSIVPKCEISTSESLMAKAATLSSDLYSITVYRDGDFFAYGFFDNIESMKLNLKQGSSYAIYAFLVKDAKTMLGEYYSSINGGISMNNKVGPFHENNIGSYVYIGTNSFFYTGQQQKYYMGSDDTIADYKTTSDFKPMDKAVVNDVKYPACTDWFYGEVNGYIPTGEYSTMEFPLKRTGFKLKYELSGVTDGKVTVKVYNSERTFIENTTSSKSYESDTQFIAFYDTYSAWKYADNYTENLTVAVTWVRGTGITQDLGTKTIQVKRNCLNNIKIKLGSDDQGSTISLTTEEESSIDSAESNITVKP